MQSQTTSGFDIAQFKTVLEQAPTKENGWELGYDGVVDKNFKDSTMRTYTKQGTPGGFTLRIEAVLKGVKAENYVKMLRDVSLRNKMEGPVKNFKIIEETSKNTDVIYQELSLPFPLTNRDFVQERLFVSNKQDPELVAKLGLFNWDHAYTAVLVQSTERSECPAKSSPVRGETIMHYTLLEEDPNDNTVLKVKIIVCQALNGNIPQGMPSAAAEKMPRNMITDLLKSYKKCFN